MVNQASVKLGQQGQAQVRGEVHKCCVTSRIGLAKSTNLTAPETTLNSQNSLVKGFLNMCERIDLDGGPEYSGFYLTIFPVTLI